MRNLYQRVQTCLEQEKDYTLVLFILLFLVVYCLEIISFSPMFDSRNFSFCFASNAFTAIFIGCIIAIIVLYIVAIFSLAEILHRIKIYFSNKFKKPSTKTSTNKELLPFNEKGFLLINALISVLIVSIALLALISAYTQNTKLTKTNDTYAHAVYLAQHTLEKLRENDGKTTSPDLSWKPYETFETYDNTIYTISVTPEKITVANYNDYLKPYKATVTWDDGKASVSVVSYYYLKQ